MRPRPVLAAVIVLTALVGCDAGRDAPLRPYPGAATDGSVFVPGSVAAADRPYVDALAANFVDGGRLVARLDEPDATCVAERWIATLDPAALGAAGLSAEAMTNVTLARLRAAVTLDRPRAEALVAAYETCGVDHTGAFLDSLLLTSQITLGQRVCLLESLPAGLVGEITVSALVDATVQADLTAQYQQALDACPVG